MFVPGWFSDWASRLRDARRRRRARAELRAMNDLELRDIGLGRSDVSSALDGRFGRDAEGGARPGRE